MTCHASQVARGEGAGQLSTCQHAEADQHHPEAGAQAQHEVALLRRLYGACMVGLGQRVLPVQALVPKCAAAVTPAPGALEADLQQDASPVNVSLSTTAGYVTARPPYKSCTASQIHCMPSDPAPHSVELEVPHVLPPTPAAAALLHEARAVQLGEPLALDAGAGVQPIDVLADDAGQLARPLQGYQKLRSTANFEAEALQYPQTRICPDL